MSLEITCYGAVEEIGGNKILLEDGGTRVLLDCGVAFGRQGQYFNELLRPRATRGLLDPLSLGLLPPLEGLYRDDLTPPGLWDRFQNHALYRDLRRGNGGPAVDAVFISHAHLDHNGDLSYLDPTIPVYTSKVSAFIARAMQLTGMSSFEREMTFVSPRSPTEIGVLASDRGSPYRARSHAFLDGALSEGAQAWWTNSPSPTKALEPAPAQAASGAVDGLRYRWWPVDHSIPGAVGLALETSEGWIGYTGDIRFHGKHGEATHRFATELAALKPLALFCEGTHTASKAPLTEIAIVQNALALLQETAGQLVIADFGPRNVERLLSFLYVATRAQRTLLVQPKDIYLLQAIALADPAAFPDPTRLPNLALYADPKAAPRLWERAIREDWQARTVSPEEVSRTPGEYILAWSLWDLNDLLDLEGITEGVYLYSSSRAYDDEQAADLDRLRNWVSLMGLTLQGDPDDPTTVRLHAAGHASGPELAEFVKQVRPQKLIPIHTEQPDWWQSQLADTGIKICLPQMGQPMAIG
jgi:ribonuclease J